MRAQSRLEHTEPGGGGGPTLGCHSGLFCINRMCTIPPPHKTYTFNLHNKESFFCTPKINFPQLQNLVYLFYILLNSKKKRVFSQNSFCSVTY